MERMEWGHRLILNVFFSPLRTVTTLVALTAVVWAFWSPTWPWVPLLILATLIIVNRVIFSLRRPKHLHVDDLSPQANEMLVRFWDYYQMPNTGSDFSSSTSVIQMGAVAVGIIGAFQGLWWGLAGATIFWLVLTPIARAFNPTHFIRGTDMEVAHNEIIAWIGHSRP